MAKTREPRRRHGTRTAEPAQESRSHYLIVGLALAGLWLLNRDKSLLFHAVQMLVVMSALTTLQIVLRLHAGQAPTYVRLIVAKLVLVALAVGAEWLLAPETSRSNAVVAGGLVVLVTVLGPVLDRLAARHIASAAGPTSADVAAASSFTGRGRRPLSEPAESQVAVDRDAVASPRKD